VVGFIPGQDIIAVSNAPNSAYSFTSVGNDILISNNNAGTVSGIRLTGVLPAGFVGLINSEASAETAVGADFFQQAGAAPPVVTPPPVGTTSSIDVGTLSTRTTVDGASGNVTFTDNAAVTSNVNIINFTAGDSIAVTGATAANYSFTTGNFDGGATANDLQLSFNNNATGAVNSIFILNVVSPAAFVFNLATATAAVGFNFITFG